MLNVTATATKKPCLQIVVAKFLVFYNNKQCWYANLQVSFIAVGLDTNFMPSTSMSIYSKKLKQTNIHLKFWFYKQTNKALCLFKQTTDSLLYLLIHTDPSTCKSNYLLFAYRRKEYNNDNLLRHCNNHYIEKLLIN